MPTNLDESIGLQTNRMQKKLLRYLNRSLESYNITLEQWVVLSTLAEQENINQKTLSLKSGKDPASLLRILDILERKYLVKRGADKLDRRAFLLQITAQGKSLVENVAPFIEEKFKEITADIPNDKVTIFKQVLKKMDDNLEFLLNH
ncbi:MAG: MarR family transcriptional regulator [Ruminococcaceae bacterium]|jgi:DNA-binding MarR family transcriptional regulator|nr:MarR family transcriptional regulator [Oscillospiraceae bacterium]